jgi:hypothetical protein
MRLLVSAGGFLALTFAPFELLEPAGSRCRLAVFYSAQGLVLVVYDEAVVSSLDLLDDDRCRFGIDEPGFDVLRAAVSSAELAGGQQLNLAARDDADGQRCDSESGEAGFGTGLLVHPAIF